MPLGKPTVAVVFPNWSISSPMPPHLPKATAETEYILYSLCLCLNIFPSNSAGVTAGQPLVPFPVVVACHFLALLMWLTFGCHRNSTRVCASASKEGDCLPCFAWVMKEGDFNEVNCEFVTLIVLQSHSNLWLGCRQGKVGPK